jgi:hypothetical protein
VESERILLWGTLSLGRNIWGERIFASYWKFEIEIEIEIVLF